MAILQTISYPDLAESSIRVIHEILSTYVGQTKILGGVSVVFRDADIVQDIREVKTPINKPLLYVRPIGSVQDLDELKVEHPTDQRKFAYQARGKVRYIFGIATATDPGRSEDSYRGMIREYDNYAAIFRTQHQRFNQRGMSVLHLDAVPKQVPIEEYVSVFGELRLELWATYFRDASTD